MVASADSGDPALPGVLIQRKDPEQGAACLETSRPLEELELQDNLCTLRDAL